MTRPNRFACPCCGYLTLPAKASGTFKICQVCFWEDDPVQLRDPHYAGGANEVSLNEARRHFAAFGASELRFKSYVRPLLPDERPTSQGQPD